MEILPSGIVPTPANKPLHRTAAIAAARCSGDPFHGEVYSTPHWCLDSWLIWEKLQASHVWLVAGSP